MCRLLERASIHPLFAWMHRTRMFKLEPGLTLFTGLRGLWDDYKTVHITNNRCEFVARTPRCFALAWTHTVRFKVVKMSADRYRENIVFNCAKFLLLVALLSLLGACGGGGGGGGGGGPTSPTNGGPVPNTVSGSVMFKGAPMAGATITIFNNNTNPSTIFSTVTTDANGSYTVPELPTGCHCISNYSFVATKTGFSFNPYMANNPTGNRSAYLWDAPPENWYVNVGANVTRAGFNGMFTNPNGGSGIMFNTIDFNSTTGNNVSGANFTAYDGSNPPANLTATGQTTSYVMGDDASLHQGVAWPATRYVDNQNGTVTDNLTGLIWLKNAGCFAPTVWANAISDVNQLASGACGLSDGSTAGQWRLPNLVELESMVDVSASNPVVMPGSPFTNVSSNYYWSSTAYFGGQEGTTNAWVINFADGSYINDGKQNLMLTSNNAVWAVKGSGGGTAPAHLQATGEYVLFVNGDDGSIESGQALPAPRFIDNANGTVTDTATGLIWLKQANCINQTWSAAIAAVNGLASGQCGLTDGSVAGSWRMPNRHEMQSIADRGQNNQADYFGESFVSGFAGVKSQPAIFNGFIQFQFYWTSTTDATDPTQAWTVFSCDYGVYGTTKTNNGYTLAVRN